MGVETLKQRILSERTTGVGKAYESSEKENHPQQRETCRASRALLYCSGVNLGGGRRASGIGVAGKGRGRKTTRGSSRGSLRRRAWKSLQPVKIQTWKYSREVGGGIEQTYQGQVHYVTVSWLAEIQGELFVAMERTSFC